MVRISGGELKDGDIAYLVVPEVQRAGAEEALREIVDPRSSLFSQAQRKLNAKHDAV